MKKRLFRNLLMLCLLVAALTVITLTVMASKPADYSMRFYGDTLPKENPPVTEINMNATFYCQKCNKTTALTPSSIITLTGIQFPVDNDHHKMALTGSISTVTCSSCNNSIGPINFNVTFAAQNGYFCHTGAYYELLEASGSQTIGSDRITFVIGTTPNYTLKQCSPRPATCAQVGIKEGVNCKHCDGCGKYFNPDGVEIAASQVEIEKTAHDYDPVTGLCKNNCGSKAAASLNGELKDSFEAAVGAYNNVNGGTLRVFTTPTGESFTLKKSGKLIVTSGVTLPNIILEGNPNVTIENAGTISSIKMNQSGTVTIENSGTIGSIEMGRSPGTLTIKNRNQIDLVKTDTPINGNVRTISITNYSGSIIKTIEAPNTMLTIQNDGTIEDLTGYFHSVADDPLRENMVKLQCGAGIYKKITSVKLWAGHDESTRDTADFSWCLSNGNYFYFENDKSWHQGSNDPDIAQQIWLYNVYVSGLPIASIDVTGTADGVQVNPTAEEDGRLSMTVKAGQTVTLTGGVTLPDQGLKSDKEKLAYSWTCNAPGGSGSGNVFKFEDILYGEYDLTLTVTDNQYHHLKKVNIHIKAEKPAGEKIELFFRIPSSGGVFTKSYDGTTAKPKPPHEVEIEFYVKNNSDAERTIRVPSDCYKPTITYASPNCSADNPITVTVALTEKGAENYTLGTNNTATVTVDGEITQAAPIYTISQAATAHVGDSVFQRLTFAGFWYGRDTNRQPLFTSVTPGTTIMVEDEPLSVTFYRLHPSNITHRGTSSTSISPSDFIHDPSMNELLTADSTFTAVGEYYVYAVVQPTRNFEGVEKTFCCVINVQNTEASAKHHTNYTGWDGTFTASEPIAANKTKSVYLSSSLPTIYTELLLGQGKNLTLCLNGKTLSATNGVTSYNHIRVTDSAALTIDDCIGTGTVKGAAANGGWGGIAYVKDGTLTIKHGKFTGGTASTGGGAIVVEAGGTLIIKGGEISGNTVTSGNGGAIYVKSGGVVNMYGGKIQNNHAYSGNGGAIYVEAGGTLNLYGGKITGNTASGLGGGIYVEKGGRVNIQGNPVVTGNTAGGQTSNVYLAQNQRLYAKDMISDAKIGISVEATSYPAGFAVSEQNYSAYFTPDAPDTFVVFSGSALTLCTKPSATLEGSTLTVKTGGNYMDNTVLLFVAEYSADGRLLTAQSQAVKLGTPDYTFKVSSNKIKCFLLNAQTYTPLMEAFVFN